MLNDGPVEVKSVSRAFAVIEAVQGLDGGSLREISTETELPQSTAYDYLSSLETLGYVRRTGGEYRMGLRFLDHGMFVRNDHPLVRQGSATLEKLAEETNEVAWLVTEDQGMGVFLDKKMGADAVQTLARVGSYRHLHYIASGRAILAHLPEARIDEIVERHGLPGRTEQSITDSARLRDELDAIRDRGYAVNADDATKGVRAVGAPILRDDGVAGAISISGPRERVSEARLEEDFVTPLLAATNEVELRLETEIE